MEPDDERDTPTDEAPHFVLEVQSSVLGQTAATQDD